MPTWLSSPLAPAWAQAVFAGVAIIGAVWVSVWQQSRTRRAAATIKANEDKAHLRRLTVGLRAEAEAALQAARSQQEGLDQTLRQLVDAHDRGVPVLASGPIHPGSMAVTDAIVYRQVAAEIGRLPPEVIKWLVQFYTYAMQLSRFADGAPQAIEAYKIVSQSGPRLRLSAALLLRALEKFEASDFVLDADIRVKLEEIKELAAKVGYPLAELAKERGLVV